MGNDVLSSARYEANKAVRCDYVIRNDLFVFFCLFFLLFFLTTAVVSASIRNVLGQTSN